MQSRQLDPTLVLSFKLPLEEMQKRESKTPELCYLHFTPPTTPSSQPAESSWQFAFRVVSSEKTSTFRKQNEESIPPDQRLVLWHKDQHNSEKADGCVPLENCFSPDGLAPTVAAIRANSLLRVTPDEGESYLEMRAGEECHLHFIFSGELFNQHLEQGWGFSASFGTTGINEITDSWRESNEGIPVGSELDGLRDIHGCVTARVETVAELSYPLHSSPVDLFKAGYSDIESIMSKKLAAGEVVPGWQLRDLDSVLQPHSPVVTLDLSKIREMYKDSKLFDPFLKTPGVVTFFDLPPPATSSAPDVPAIASIVQTKAEDRGEAAIEPSKILALGNGMQKLEQHAKEAALSKTALPIKPAAERLIQLLLASEQLPNWKHAEAYIKNEGEYKRVFNNLGKFNEFLKKPESLGKIDPLLETTNRLQKEVMITLMFVHDLEVQAMCTDNKTPDRILAVMGKDPNWMKEIAILLSNTETQCSSLSQNRAFARFRDLSGQGGVMWPHSPHLRRHIERSSFIFRPTLMKRDRCVCDYCGVTVTGWRMWHNPYALHDWSKRHPMTPPARTH